MVDDGDMNIIIIIIRPNVEVRRVHFVVSRWDLFV